MSIPELDVKRPVKAMTEDCPELEFFGARIKCRNPRLAALLNSDVTEDVVVVGRRAVDLVVADDARADEDEEPVGVAQVVPLNGPTSEED